MPYTCRRCSTKPCSTTFEIHGMWVTSRRVPLRYRSPILCAVTYCDCQYESTAAESAPPGSKYKDVLRPLLRGPRLQSYWWGSPPRRRASSIRRRFQMRLADYRKQRSMPHSFALTPLLRSCPKFRLRRASEVRSPGRFRAPSSMCLDRSDSGSRPPLR